MYNLDVQLVLDNIDSIYNIDTFHTRLIYISKGEGYENLSFFEC